MKSYFALCMAICTLLTHVTSSFAVDPASLPIGSKGALAAYAATQARLGDSMVSSQDRLVSPTDKVQISVTGIGANEIANKLVSPSESFSFKLSDISKASNVYLNSYIWDKEGYLLFWSSVNLKTQENGSGRLKVDPSSKLTFKLYHQIPIRIPGATSASIRYEEDGKQWWLDLGYVSSDGTFMFPSSYAETGGTLVIGKQSGQIAYSLATGKSVPGVIVTGNPINSVVENHVSASDKGLAAASTLLAAGTLTAPSANQWEWTNPPTAMFTVTKSGSTRKCQATFLMPADVLTDKSEILEATAVDYDRLSANGTFETIPATSITVTKNPTGSVTIDVIWSLHNNAGEPDGTIWGASLKIKKYEDRTPPSAPYYGGGQG